MNDLIWAGSIVASAAILALGAVGIVVSYMGHANQRVKIAGEAKTAEMEATAAKTLAEAELARVKTRLIEAETIQRYVGYRGEPTAAAAAHMRRYADQYWGKASCSS